MVLKTSVAPMTSTDMITSLASMTSTASLASKNQKLLTLYILSDFPGIRNLSSLNDLNSLNGLNNLDSLFSSKNLGILMFSSTLAPKWPILVSQCEMDHQKPTILLNFGTLSLGGCWGHPMRQKLNLKDKCQISKPNEYTDNFKSYLIYIFLSVRAKL